MSDSVLISLLARSMLAGEPAVEAVRARAVETLGWTWRWLRPLSRRYVAAFANGTRPRHRDVITFLRNDQGFRTALKRHHRRLYIARWIAEPQRMYPAAIARQWDLPPLETVADLAAWLSLTIEELDWFADLKGLGYKLPNAKLQHYHYRILPKRSGGIRLTECPKPRLKELQRRILSGILDRIPAHDAVHGFVKGRSIVTFAAPHVGQRAVLRLDLENFFPTFPAARVQALFRTLGYPETVSNLLAGICTNATPPSAWAGQAHVIDLPNWNDARALYARPHLPQGAPTSPALANLTAYRLDQRLSSLAASAGAAYSRYADDLAFSGGEQFQRGVARFAIHAAAIALEEGFQVNHRKTRIMRQGVRQRLAGVIVNQKANLPRRELELLEAILTNCVRLGSESQNRAAHPNFRAHLEGRVGFVEMVNREKGARFRALLEKIEWA